MVDIKLTPYVWADLEGMVSVETDKAFGVLVGDETVWIPFSHCESIEWKDYGECELSEGLSISTNDAYITGVYISEWLADKIGLDYER